MATDLNEVIEQEIAQAKGSRIDRADIKSVLQQFTSRNGLGPLTLDEQGCVALSIGEDLEITLAYSQAMNGLIAAAALPDELQQSEDLLRELLQSNLDWQNIAGGTFLIPPGSDVIHYCRLIPIGKGDDETFERRLMDFAETANSVLMDLTLAIDDDRIASDNLFETDSHRLADQNRTSLGGMN